MSSISHNSFSSNSFPKNERQQNTVSPLRRWLDRTQSYCHHRKALAENAVNGKFEVLEKNNMKLDFKLSKRNVKELCKFIDDHFNQAELTHYKNLNMQTIKESFVKSFSLDFKQYSLLELIRGELPRENLIVGNIMIANSVYNLFFWIEELCDHLIISTKDLNILEIAVLGAVHAIIIMLNTFPDKNDRPNYSKDILVFSFKKLREYLGKNEWINNLDRSHSPNKNENFIGKTPNQELNVRPRKLYTANTVNNKYHKLYKKLLVFTEILTKMEHGNTTGEYFMEKNRFERQIPIPRLLKIIENLENNGFLKVNDACMAGNNERVSYPLEKPRLSVGERNFEGYLQKFKQWFELHNTIYDDKQSDKALAKINSRLERKLEIDKMGDRKNFMISEFPEYS